MSFRKRSESFEQPEDGEQDVRIGRIGTKPCSTVRFVK
jgi:hypothetical protein